jgi:hypothetical protein
VNLGFAALLAVNAVVFFAVFVALGKTLFGSRADKRRYKRYLYEMQVTKFPQPTVPIHTNSDNSNKN